MLKRSVYCLVLFFLWPIGGYAQDPDTTDIFEMSVEDLLHLKIESGGKEEESVANIPASVVIITQKEIEKQGFRTLEEILCHVPGMYMVNDYLWFGSDNYGVRGFFTAGAFGNMVVMVNGILQKEDWYNSFPLTKVNVPVEAIDRIEIIRGPMSVAYGSNAFLGSVNIITNNAENDNKVSAAGGTGGRYKAFTKFAGSSSDFNYSLSASFFGSEGIDKAYADMMQRPDDPQRGLRAWNLAPDARTKGQLEDHRAFLSTSLAFKGFYFESSNTFTARGVIDFYPGHADGHLAEIQSSNAVFGYKSDIRHHSRLNIQLGHYSFRNRLDYKHDSDTAGYTFNDIYSDAADIQINYGFEPNSLFKVEAGLYYRYIYRDKLIVDAPNLSRDYINLEAGLNRNRAKHNRAVSLQSTFSPNPSLRFIGGLRVEQSPQYNIGYRLRLNPADNNTDYLKREGTYLHDNPMFIPRMAVLYNFLEIHHLKLMYGMAVKEPSIGENMDVVRFPARPQLEPAYMHTLELNYTGIVAEFLSINGSLFYNRANNLISRTNTIQDGRMQLFNTNSGERETAGSEISLVMQPAKFLLSKLSFTYQKSRNLQPGYEDIALGYAPEFLAHASASYRFWKTHTIAVSGYYIDAVHTYWTPDQPESINDRRSALQLIKDGHRIGKTAPAYFLANLNIRFNDLFEKGMFLALYLYNLADTEVRYPTTRSNDIFDRGTLGYGRNFSLTLGWKF